MISEKNFKKFIINIEQFALYIGIASTLIISWFLFIFFPIWQFYFIPGTIGGIITAKNYYRGFFAGFLGTLFAQIVFLNFAFFSVVESVELVMGIVLDISGMGIIIHVLIILIWSSFSGIGGLIGVSIYFLFPFYEKAASERET
ncbi:MAG: hypothetical protein ACFFAU_08600 [Candidatus Hodarchaeota archaeon]